MKPMINIENAKWVSPDDVISITRYGREVTFFFSGQAALVVEKDTSNAAIKLAEEYAAKINETRTP